MNTESQKRINHDNFYDDPNYWPYYFTSLYSASIKIMDTNMESYVVDIVNEVLQEFIDTQSESNDPKVLN